MLIVVDVDVMLAKRKLAVGELAERVGITPTNLAVSLFRGPASWWGVNLGGRWRLCGLA